MSDKKKPMVFSHGNGFPSSSYQQLFKYLDAFAINYIDTYGTGAYPINLNWENSILEITDFIERNYEEPVLAVGHSFGGVISILAASRRPELFKQVIAIDPPLFGIIKRYVIGALRVFGEEGRVFKEPMLARRRRDKFKSKEEALEYFKEKAFFKRFDPKALEDYVNYGLVEDGEGGFKLKIPKLIEEQIFKYMPCFLSSERFDAEKVTFLYGDRKGAHDSKDIFWLKWMLKGAKFKEYSGSHMIPFENPKGCGDLIKSAIIK